MGSASDGPAERPHDIEALRTTLEESRSVIDHQVQTFNDVDSKAAQTFRLEVILLGLLVTALTFVLRTDPMTIDPYLNPYTAWGIISLEISFITAVIVYSSTSIQTGVGPNDIGRLISRRYTERDWLILLLRSTGEWIRFNEQQQAWNGLLLSVSHAALVLAVLLLSAGIGGPHLTEFLAAITFW